MNSPKTTFTAEILLPGTAVSVEFEDGDILWDDSSTMLWEDSTVIEWSYSVDISPDVYFNSSVPHTTFSGEVEA